MSPYSSVPDLSHSKLNRFLFSCKAAIKHPARIMTSGAYRENAIIISDDENEAVATKDRKPR